MRFVLDIPGFEGREVVVEFARSGSARVLVDGEPAKPGWRKREVQLVRNDGRTVTACFKGGFLDPTRPSRSMGPWCRCSSRCAGTTGSGRGCPWR